MLYRNYAVTIARTGDDIIFLRNTSGDSELVAETLREVGSLDATAHIATGCVRKSKSTFGDYTVADYIRRGAA